ncbi:exodeoxyribonuclease III [Mobilicoccus pelagius]|uniref:Putative exodeoxyribonuclease n=1 Tax=Mobilicoccus pelagius NBRC 104925 TaxID=1089455 RepID=H5USM0_9MICO|nr:exodeoxyribonuclease III [Mobilicoccus pelagius]GAB48728.1 putative exodeoxyribonuclease [Mobilicoccus pelagius NBRC 104925]
MRVASFNVNGIRAAQRRGFEEWLAGRGCDVVALQEVRCPAPMLPEGVFGDYHLAYDQGTINGRNGVAVLTRERPAAVRAWGSGVLVRASGETHLEEEGHDLAWPLSRDLRRFAAEGRYVEVDLADAPVTIASLYLPKGGLPAELQVPGRMRGEPDGGAKYDRKMRFLAGFARHLTAARRASASRGREYLVVGDFNVAHTRQDLKNWRTNGRSEGFLPEEREWFSSILSPRSLVDVVRHVHPDEDGPYSWWSWMGQSFAKNVGWRIDYHLASPRLARTATSAVVDREASYEERLSDHAPVVVDYAFPACPPPPGGCAGGG